MTSIPNDTGFDIILRQERVGDDLVWTAIHPRLAGCTATGRSESEALANLAHSRAAWIELGQSMGDPLPEPRSGASIAVSYAPHPGAFQSHFVASEAHNTMGQTLVTA